MSTSAGLDAAPVEKALKKGGVQAIAPCEDCEPSADGLSAVDESGNQVLNEKQKLRERFHIFVHFTHETFIGMGYTSVSLSIWNFEFGIR